MIRLYAALTLGHFRKHRLEFFLCLAGVALGVAVVISIESAVSACVGSFRGAVESLAERSTHAIFGADGPIPDATYIALLKQRLDPPLAPIIDRGVMASAGGGGPVLARLLGVDVFSERALRSFTQLQSSLDESARLAFLTQPGQVVLVDSLAQRLGVKRGDALRLVVGARRVDATVCGVVEVKGVARAQLPDLVIADLATAQELTDSLGFIDRIDTRLDGPRQERQLQAALPPGLELRSTSRQSSSLSDLIASYRMNLGALSLMASFVAVFIVYNSMLVSVQQRTATLGVLRCLGASRWQLGGLYLAEAAIFAAVGAGIGILAGAALSRTMVGLIANTINDLYAPVRPAAPALSAGLAARGAGVSLASCLLGAIVPLWRAASLPPINAFRRTERHRLAQNASLWAIAAGALLLAGAWGVWKLPGNSPAAGFVMALLVALGFALLCPMLTRWACAAVRWAARRGQLLPAQMAALSVGRSLGITSVAVAATMLAMAMNISVRTMVFSFRTALASWMEQRFAADVLVGPELLVRHKIDATLDPRVPEFFLSQPQVQRVVQYRLRQVALDRKSAMLMGADVRPVIKTLPMKQLLASADAFDPGADALISEPLAGRLHLSLGDSLNFSTPTGPRAFRVFGVFYDFGNERGSVMIDRATYAADWRDLRVTSLYVTLKPGEDATALAATWSAQLRRDYPVVVNTSRTVRGEVLQIFDQTFAVTEVLTWLAGGVAFCGLAGSLLALTLSRQREYSVLAAIGMTDRQISVWIVTQGLIIATSAAVVASAAGTLLAFVLAFVIQYRSFGWSIPTQPQPRFWLQNLALALLAAVVAAIYPVIRARRLAPAGGLRYE